MRNFLTVIAFLAIIPSAFSQSTDSLTAKDYANAENFLRYTTQQYVDNDNIRPNWISNDKFWYRNLNVQGSEFILVDAAKGKRTAAFDQQKLATALNAATGLNYQPLMLPFRTIEYSPDEKSIIFNIKTNAILMHAQLFGKE